MTNQIQNPKIQQSEVAPPTTRCLSEVRPPTRGFTLIELLVVISIIGMLSSVVMVSLQGAREKGRIGAGIKFSTHNYRAFGADALAIYNFDDSAVDENGDGLILDHSGNRLNLTPVGDCAENHHDCTYDQLPAYSQSKKYLSLNGTNDYAYTLSSGMSFPSGLIPNWTISAWIKPDSIGNDMPIALVYDTSPSPNIIARLRLGTNLSMIANASGCNSGDVSGVQVNKWQHVAVSFNSNGSPRKFNFYIDGKLIRSVNTTSVPNCSIAINPSGQIIVGYYKASPLVTSHYFTGSMDDVAIYRQTLIASDIEKIYAESAHRYGIALE